MSSSLHAITYQDLFEKNSNIRPLTLVVPATQKVVILSDSHLHSNFNQQQFDHLKQAITLADRVILNGDFWEDSSITFAHFITSKWRALFPYLLEKKAIYLFGNHDMPFHSDERIFLFCVEAGFQLKLQAGDIKLHIEHGHLLLGPVSRKVLTLFQHRPRLLEFMTAPLGIVAKFIRQRVLKGKTESLQWFNTGFKKKRPDRVSDNEFLVMGHTHVVEVDVQNKYFNTGLTHDGHFSYLTVQQNEIELRKI